MIYEIKNDELTVLADSTGAELKSIRKNDDEDKIEYLWQLNPDVWERQAPLLFPLIGRLKDEEYTYDGKTYKTDIHGFARFSEFTVEKPSDSEINFVLEENEKTLGEYPFEFRLTVSYKLTGTSIIKSHIIENKGDGAMYYEVGGHEGYNLSLFEGEKMEDYFIDFPGMKGLETYTADEDIMMNRKKSPVALDEGKLYLGPEVFIDDAIIADAFKVRKVSLRNNRNNRGIDVEFNDFKYLGIWTKPFRTNYICIEPWSSLPDCNYLGKELTEKKDIRKLDEGKSEELAYTITVI